MTIKPIKTKKDYQNALERLELIAEKGIENEKFIIHNSQKFNTIKIISDEQR